MILAATIVLYTNQGYVSSLRPSRATVSVYVILLLHETREQTDNAGNRLTTT